MMIRSGTGIIAVALLMACSPQTQADTRAGGVDPQHVPQTEEHPISGLAITDLTVTSGDKTHEFRVEVANTPEAQARGLMFRTELGDNEGMIFPSDPPAPRSFWMRNTPLSLDIIFIGVDGRISNIAANTVPYSLESVPSEGVTSGVLEIRGGLAAELAIKPGDKVEWVLGE